MLKLAVLYEDNSIFVSYTPEEFEQELQMWITKGKSVKEAMEIMVKTVKSKTLTV